MVDNALMFLYHTVSGERHLVEEEAIRELVRQIYAPESMGVIELPAEFVAHSVLESLVRKGMAGVIPRDVDTRKPLNFLPILNLQKDVEKAQTRGELELVLDNALQYLSQIHFMLSLPAGSSVGQSISQSVVGLSFPSSLSIDMVGSVLEQVRHANLHAVSLYAGSAFSPEYWNGMWDLLVQHDNPYVLHTGLRDFVNGVARQVDSARGRSLDIQTVVTCRPEELAVLEGLCYERVQCNVLVACREEVELAIPHLHRLGVAEYVLTLLYTQRNLSFFQEQVFISDEELFSTPISMRAIFRNQKLNANYFGNLYIMPNGCWRAKPVGEDLGRVADTTAIEVISRELDSNTAWRQVRTSPLCGGCNYRYLCLPPSSLEGTLGRGNLCGIVH